MTHSPLQILSLLARPTALCNDLLGSRLALHRATWYLRSRDVSFPAPRVAHVGRSSDGRSAVSESDRPPSRFPAASRLVLTTCDQTPLARCNTIRAVSSQSGAEGSGTGTGAPGGGPAYGGASRGLNMADGIVADGGPPGGACRNLSREAR